MNILKQLFAGKELEKLARFETGMYLATRWFASIPDAVTTLEYIDNVVQGTESVNVVGDVRDTMLTRAEEAENFSLTVFANERNGLALTIKELMVELEQKEAETNKLYARLGHETLRADQGWSRYEEANAKYKSMETKFVAASASVVQQTKCASIAGEQAFKWYAALLDCATALNLKKHELIQTPVKLRQFLANHKFVFINERKPIPVPQKKTMMAQALDLVGSPMYLVPGIPCNACEDNCCVPQNAGCAIVQMRTPK